MSKFSLDVLQEHVFPYTQSNDPDVVLGAAFGEDVALTRIGDDLLASHVDPIVGAIGNIGWLAVHVACNDIATSGVKPRWIHMLVLVPHMEDIELLESIMRDARRAADEIGVSIIGGHTGYSAGISRPLVSVTALGAADGKKPVRTGGAKVGDQVLITKGVALEGTAILAADFADVAWEKCLSKEEIAEAANLMGDVSVVREALAMAEQGVSAMHDVTRGGVLETLLEIASLSDVAIEAHMESMPIPDIVKRFSYAMDYDPLRMISSGTLAVTVPPENVAGVSQALDDLGVSYAFVGEVKAGKGVTVVGAGHEVDHHDAICCEEDELARLWALYPRE